LTDVSRQGFGQRPKAQAQSGADLHEGSYSVSHKILASCLTAAAVLISVGAMAQREPGFPTFSPPPVTSQSAQMP